MLVYIVFFKQKTAYKMRISDWSSDVCASDLRPSPSLHLAAFPHRQIRIALRSLAIRQPDARLDERVSVVGSAFTNVDRSGSALTGALVTRHPCQGRRADARGAQDGQQRASGSERGDV